MGNQAGISVTSPPLTNSSTTARRMLEILPAESAEEAGADAGGDRPAGPKDKLGGISAYHSLR